MLLVAGGVGVASMVTMLRFLLLLCAKPVDINLGGLASLTPGVVSLTPCCFRHFRGCVLLGSSRVAVCIVHVYLLLHDP